jgi:hypothetical protein
VPSISAIVRHCDRGGERAREMSARACFAVEPASQPNQINFVQPAASRRFFQVAGPILLQAFLWVLIAVTFAALLVLTGSQTWNSSLHFSAVNWLPWAVLAPLVFWFSRQFPLERGHLLTSVPAHLVACVICTSLTLWLATNYSPFYRPRESRPREGIVTIEREGIDPGRDNRRRQPPPGEDSRRNRSDHPERAGRPPFQHRGIFDGWNGPFAGWLLLRSNFAAVVYFIIVIAAHAAGFYRRAQERERQALALTAGLNRAKLDALRLQLQPHFLFNTLNAISTLVHRDATAADELIGDLSELLRLSLQNTAHEVPLRREIELLDCYLAIEQTRLGLRLRIVREIDPAVLSALVPTFLLQPLVENAIRHGIEPRLAAGTVRIRAQGVAGTVNLSVSDDGVGLNPVDGAADHRGIGLANTEARLRALHGNAAKLAIAAAPGGGVTVSVTLPFTTVPQIEPAATESK